MSQSSAQFNQGVYDFQMEVFKMMLEKFDGKVVGSEDFNMDKLKETFFEGYTPGQKVKKKKETKPKPLSGYTFFGKENKEAFNEEMAKMDEKPRFVTFVGQKWKELSKEEQEEWNKKAIADFESKQPTV
tara:strand:- start:3507 stop:3893 length:387 start_codon:yes stop_codon:yes gene_type:complete